MKPQNVSDHVHYFAFEEDEENGDIIGRYDACMTRDDGAGVWSPSSGKWWPMKDYDRAKKVAQAMAQTYAEYNPRS